MPGIATRKQVSFCVHSAVYEFLLASYRRRLRRHQHQFLNAIHKFHTEWKRNPHFETERRKTTNRRIGGREGEGRLARMSDTVSGREPEQKSSVLRLFDLSIGCTKTIVLKTIRGKASNKIARWRISLEKAKKKRKKEEHHIDVWCWSFYTDGNYTIYLKQRHNVYFSHSVCLPFLYIFHCVVHYVSLFSFCVWANTQ